MFRVMQLQSGKYCRNDCLPVGLAVIVECQCGRKNRIPDEAKPGFRCQCGNPACQRELYIVTSSASNSRSRKPGDGRRFFRAAVITLFAVSACALYTPILSARRRNPHEGIYTLRDPGSGFTTKVYLDHRPDVGESLQLLDDAEVRATAAQAKMYEATLAIEEQYKEAGFKERTLRFAKGEVESIPVAVGGLAKAAVHPIEFSYRIASHPWSTVPFVSNAISLRKLYANGIVSAASFEHAGKDIGLGTLLLFLLFGYGVAALFLNRTSDSSLAGRIRWFFATPIFLNHANLNTLRNWAKKLCTFRIELEGTERVQPMGYPNLNRRHKVIFLLTLIVTGLLLFNGLAIGKGLGVVFLGVATAWIVGSNGFLIFVLKARKGWKDT